MPALLQAVKRHGPGRLILARIVEALLPTVCNHCRRLFVSSQYGPAEGPDTGQTAKRFAALTRSYLCPACAVDFQPIHSPLCTCCGEPFVAPAGVNHLCAQCEGRTRPYRTARAVAGYEGAVRSLIREYKYQGKVQLALPLGRLLWYTLLDHWDPAQIDGIIPVPLHSGRLRQRGFNQSDLLTRRWREYGSVVKEGCFWVDDGVLERTRATPSQTGLDRQQRRDNLKDAFHVVDPARVVERHLLLVDDVMTTGATIEACAAALLAAGAAAVDVLTLARVVQV